MEEITKNEERLHHPHSPSSWAKLRKCRLYKSSPTPSKWAVIGTNSHELLEGKLKEYNKSVCKDKAE
jgi:hypothetical protein